MSRILTRYIGMTITTTILIVGLMVLGLVLLLGVVSELADVGQGDYTLIRALLHVFMVAPIQFYQLFPIVGLIGGILGLGQLASRSELTVMRAAGYSLLQIVVAVLKVGLLLVLIITVLGETCAPWLAQKATIDKQIAMSGGQALQTQTGLWLHGKNTITYIHEVLPGKHLQGVTRYEFNIDGNLISETSIDEAIYQNHHWLLNGVQQSLIGDQHIVTKHIPHMTTELVLYPDLFGITKLDPTAMGMIKLYKYIRFQEDNDVTIVSFQFALWQRLLQPLSTAVMIFLAIPFVFGSLRTVTMGLRIVAGIIVGGSFYLLNQFLGPVSLVYQVPPALAASFPMVLFMIVGCFLLRRVR